MADSKTLLAQIEELGQLQFSQEEAEAIIGSKLSTPARRTALERGRLKAEAEVRSAILRMAKQGSNPAQRQIMDLMGKEGPTAPLDAPALPRQSRYKARPPPKGHL